MLLTHAERRGLIHRHRRVLRCAPFLLGIAGGGGGAAASARTAGGELKAPHTGHCIVGVLNPIASLRTSETIIFSLFI
jgi:hypothetical protein